MNYNHKNVTQFMLSSTKDVLQKYSKYTLDLRNV